MSQTVTVGQFKLVDPRTRIGYFKLVGTDVVPCADVREWGAFFETGQRQVARDRRDGVEVSTVFLGIAQDGGMFETMIFGGRFVDDEYQTRCSTYDEALDMHAAACIEAFG